MNFKVFEKIYESIKLVLQYLKLGKNKIKELNQILNLKLEELENSIDSIINNEKTKKILNEKEQLLNQIFLKLDFKKYLKTFVSQKYEEIKKNTLSNKNILIIGNPGIGKSTLINSFLNINKAKTGLGKSITQDFNSYKSSPDNGFTLIDSKGFKNYENSIKEIKTFIKKKLFSNKDEFINCIWYCFTGTRYNEEEKKVIHHLLYQYEDILPIIIVYTQTIDHDEADNYLNLIKNFLDIDKDKINYIKILAQDRYVGKNKIKLEAFGLDELKKITLERIQQTYNSSFFQSIRERIIGLYKMNINNKFKAIKKKVNVLIDIIQYNSIIFLNFENYFFELLNLIFFYDKCNHNIKDLLTENKKYYINDNNILIDDGIILLNQTLVENKIPIYNNFLNKITQSYIEEFELKINQIYEDIIKKCFPKLSKKIKERLLSDLIKELRNHLYIELDNNIEKENEIFYMNFVNDILLEFDEIHDINEDLIEGLNNEEKIDSDNNIQLNKIESNNNNNHIKKNKKYTTKKFKIDYSDINRLKFFEHQVIIKIIKYFTNEILVYIKSYMLSNNQIMNLKNLIENEIIEKLKKIDKK